MYKICAALPFCHTGDFIGYSAPRCDIGVAGVLEELANAEEAGYSDRGMNAQSWTEFTKELGSFGNSETG